MRIFKNPEPAVRNMISSASANRLATVARRVRGGVGLPVAFVIATLLALALSPASRADEPAAAAIDPGASLAALSEQARVRLQASPRVVLAPASAEVFRDLEGLEEPRGERIPNYLRALAATHPGAVQPMIRLLQAVLWHGAVPPETKLAMGLRIAQINRSPYLASHLDRYLRAMPQGPGLLAQVSSAATLESTPSLALGYAEKLTRNVNGVSKDDFRQVRAHFNDSQIVELTFTVCYFNYLARFAEGLNLPVEPWALDSAFTPPQAAHDAPFARVALVSDLQVSEVERMVERMRKFGVQRGSGLGLANSLRAMLLSPAIGGAWMDYMMAVRDGTQMDREMNLHVSFAVSMANGCRYCTLHQVQGLRRLEVSPTKLMQMKKDDSALTPRELTAVQFARKLTAKPSEVTNTDYDRLRAEFGDRGAFELLLQTCTFAFMNRFTDGLQLPSEDEAIKIYREVYGGDWN